MALGPRVFEGSEDYVVDQMAATTKFIAEDMRRGELPGLQWGVSTWTAAR